MMLLPMGFAQQSSDASGKMSDVTDTRAMSAARAALVGDHARTVAIAAEFTDPKSPQAWSVNYLCAQSSPNRELRMEILEFAAGTAPDREQKTRAQLALLDDEYYEVAVLGRRTKFNRVARVFNRASSALSKLAMLQPQDAALLALDGVYTKKKWTQVETPERRMAWLCREFLELYPQSPDAAEVKTILSALKPKIDSDYVARKLAVGDACLRRGNFDGARMNYEHAALVEAKNEAVIEALDALKQAQRRDEIDSIKAVLVGRGESNLDAADFATVHRAARALVNGSERAFADTLNVPCAAADSLAYSASAIMERKGRHENALLQLSNITAVWPGLAGGEAARAQLMNPDYSLDLAFDLALEDLERRRDEYIRTGSTTGIERDYQLAQAGVTATAGPFALMSMPILFAGDMTIRGVSEMFRTALDIEMLIDTGALYIRRFPATPRAKEVAAALAELCRKSGDLKRAKHFATLAGGATAKQQSQFAKMNAGQMLRSAATTSDPGDRRILLEKIAQQFPDTRQGKRARKDLELVAPCTARGSVTIPGRVLARDPELVAMLGIPANRADGSWLNGEIHKVGLTFAPNGATAQYLDGSAWQTIAIPRTSRRPIVARAQELLAADDMKREGEKRLSAKIIPLEISGGIGSSGIDFAPQIMPQADDVERLRFFSE